ncbi:MAG: hypothetical protein GY928_24235 [Colwellia sp.]|nr:hypothetical protein [Colwellia sp.]
MLFKVNLDSDLFLVVVPKHERAQVLSAAHDSIMGGCHLGHQKVFKKLRNRVY